MKSSRTWEVFIIMLTLVPFMVLAVVYSYLPDQVPVHFNASLEPDRYGGKEELWIIPVLLNGMLYFLFKYIPKLDPKNQINKMGNNWLYLRTAITLCLTALSCGIIYITAAAVSVDGTIIKVSALDPAYLFGIIGMLFAILGNYMPAIKPNYFVGIRTPWTLENELVWRKTHRLGGKLFLIGGIIIALSAFIFTSDIVFWILMSISLLLVFITFIYSYQLFKTLSHE